VSGLLSCQERQIGPKSEESVFVGFMKDVKCHKIWDPKDKKVYLEQICHVK